MGFDDYTDDLMDWYLKKLEHYSTDADATDRTLLNDLAFQFYIDLETERRMRNGNYSEL
jgi:hypothetical protein